VKQQYEPLSRTYVYGGPYGPPVRVARRLLKTILLSILCPKFYIVKSLTFRLQLGKTKSCFTT